MTAAKHLVAIVDDDQRLLEFLRELLQSAGYLVLTSLSAQSLLASPDLMKVDCLIADVDMPAMDGFELQKRVKETRPGLPVILMTGRHEVVDQQRALGQGNEGIFGKPFDGQALLSAISRSMRPRTEEERQ